MKETYRRRDGDATEVVVEATGVASARVRTGALEAELTVVAIGPGLFRMSDGSRTYLACVDRDGAARHVTVVGVGEARFEREAKG
jgi:hypothetical protein